MSAKTVNTKTQSIGLTGGIASGKSSASAYFRQKDIPVIDCDQIVRNLWQENDAMNQEVYDTFGLSGKNAQDRVLLSDMVFHSEPKRALLNSIVHPYVFKEVEKEKAFYQNYPLIVIDMPLLFEVGYQKEVDHTVLIYVDQQTQINRLRTRNGYKTKDALARIHSQMPLSEKKRLADYVIDNRGTLIDLYQSIDQLLKEILG
jgi:dephospho-CoA kinase